MLVQMYYYVTMRYDTYLHSLDSSTQIHISSSTHESDDNSSYKMHKHTTNKAFMETIKI